MKNREYKKLTLREFDRAAEKFDDNDPSVYNLCRKDYSNLLEELLKERTMSRRVGLWLWHGNYDVLNHKVYETNRIIMK